MTILLLYTSLVKVTKIINVKTPNLEQYKQLYLTYSQTLTCSCKKISINYGTILHIQYTLHPVCSSIFVNKTWINYLDKSTQDKYVINDFIATARYAFQTLSAFCDLIDSTISESLVQFDSNQYVSAFVTPLELFETQTQSLIDQFRSSMTKRFLLSLWMIRDTTQANGLYSALATNYKLQKFFTPDWPILAFTLSPSPQYYNNCSCATSSTCIEQSSIYDVSDGRQLFDVPNFYTGCYVIESLLQSTLQCFYNQSCINEIQKYLSPSVSMIVRPLNSPLPSKYFENSTIKELLDKLMIETWNWSNLYDRYYNECKPTQCTYTFETRNNVINIVTTLFGIAGGLITVLKLVLPRLVKIVRKKKELAQPITSKTTSKNNVQYFT